MALDSAALEEHLRLALVPGIGPSRVAALLARFGSVARVLGASPRELGGVPGIGPEFARRVAGAATPAGQARARDALRTLAGMGAVALTPHDRLYPDAFRRLADPPFVLYACGRLEQLGLPAVGVVGTRAPTEYGRDATHRLAFDLARAGYAIISGMARGIDAVAHAAAMQAGGPTVGVLGHGIDRVYPPDNRALFSRVAKHGLLITELAPGEEPLAGNFPRRNRLIAALSQGVLVVEMGERSGARHTVEFALELGRDVFAVPGPIGSAASAGTNQLLKEGARLVTGARDILEELRGVGNAPHPVVTLRPSPSPAPAPPDLPAEEARVFAALAAEARHVDEVALVAGMGTPGTLSALLALELRDLAESLPGKQFRLR